MHVFSHVQKHTLLSHFYILRYIHMWHMTWPGARSLRPEARRHWVTHVAVFCPESSTTSFLPGARASSKETICLTAIEAFIKKSYATNEKMHISQLHKPSPNVSPFLSPPLRINNDQWVSSTSSSVCSVLKPRQEAAHFKLLITLSVTPTVAFCAFFF